ncbi:MAG: hypothetical protein ABFS16_02140 [Bacteroidota bacterium]
MKAILRITLLLASIVIVGVTIAQAQRVIKGTVYMDGKPGAGITVEAHKGGNMMTSFDGKYEVEADAKTKWLKFTFIDETQKLEIEGKPGDVFDFAFTGEIPAGGEETEEGVNLQSHEELIKAQDMNFMNDLSLYVEFFKQKDYNSGKTHWKNLYNKYPASTLNLYIHGGRMYEDMLKNATTDEERDAILEDYMKLYDKRIKHFGERGYVMGRKGTSWLKYKISERENTPEGEELKNVHKTGYEYVNESVKEQGNQTEPPVLVLFMQTTVALFKLGELPKEQVVQNYEKCVEISNAIIQANENEKKVEQTRDQVLPYIEKIFGKSGAADCEAMVNIYTPQFEEKSDDIEFIKTMLIRLGRAKCTDTELFEKASEKLYELEPSALAAFNMARRYMRKDDVENAKKYYKQAMEQETDEELLATYYYEYGVFIFIKDNALSEARGYARKALAINPDYCEANMLIGDLYVAASRNFEGTDVEKKAVFWLACDYFNKARRNTDCSVGAAEKSATYRKYFPNKEEAFMEGLQEGAAYKVGGWINETTKVRF